MASRILSTLFFPKPDSFDASPFSQTRCRVVDAVYPELFVKRFDLLGAEPLDVEELEDRLGELALEILIEFQLPRGRHLVELVLKRAPDSLDALEVFLGGLSHDIAREGLHRLGAHAIGTDLERILPLEFEEQRYLLQSFNDLIAGHRGHRATVGNVPGSCKPPQSIFRPMQ